jgi:hypothetical protein
MLVCACGTGKERYRYGEPDGYCPAFIVFRIIITGMYKMD